MSWQTGDNRWVITADGPQRVWAAAGTSGWETRWLLRLVRVNIKRNLKRDAAKSPEAPQPTRWLRHTRSIWSFILQRVSIFLLRLSCYLFFFFFFSHSLIPATSRLRINYISIDRPLGRGIDIHGPPSAARPMCIPQHRSLQASCITPGSHYLLYFSAGGASGCLFGRKEFPGDPGSVLRTECALEEFYLYARQTPCFWCDVAVQARCFPSDWISYSLLLPSNISLTPRDLFISSCQSGEYLTIRAQNLKSVRRLPQLSCSKNVLKGSCPPEKW